MSAAGLLDELTASGIWLRQDSDDLLVGIRQGVNLDCFRGRIIEQKPTLLALLQLQGQIVAAASTPLADFDRKLYDALWERWWALQE
jgi:hypothetical protein